ncbi:hypothetical protein CcI156_19930 [Frankia sp. CcI156]|uniref:Uncharacterized protein n=1 Tax=Frankia casuarinae (strain DSM 45818 / CECT 9043 / HFP020203 / CcI3) TaxID=106370 RepID=Q2JE80_FRACC|nr:MULTISPECIES: hypothetical protein [Frankia]ABD10412.1 hypothetical protein Francci3_1029 [Frankia casuarinae]ETA00423.1 hypothetical protein CcI6DRAFT_04178 [Frankia sp. CcI6]EYT90601.1 hypothetical protein ThrDRAFT_03758 [Frankia casuarinae]OAA20058.1 hypothetical protein AAY23_109810 [Frankia casuarinae]OHV51103.1 hypothetical protein CgIS1_19535 [Frankia sp. CgIS1]
MTTPAGDPDLSAPLPVVPVCTTCSHLYVAHRRGRCHGDTGTRAGCACTHFTEPAPPIATDRSDLDVDVSEELPA